MNKEHLNKIEEVQEELHDIQLELETYAALFCAVDKDEFKASSLYGAGLRFSKLSEKIQRLNDTLPRYLPK